MQPQSKGIAGRYLHAGKDLPWPEGADPLTFMQAQCLRFALAEANDEVVPEYLLLAERGEVEFETGEIFRFPLGRELEFLGEFAAQRINQPFSRFQAAS